MNRQNLLPLLLVPVLLASPPARADDIGTGFTYQGELLDGGAPMTGDCDFEFTLWDDPAAGGAVGPVVAETIELIEGKFTTVLDFGAGALNGDARWLEIDVCCPSPCSPSFTTLSPRQELTPSPHAVRAVDGVGPPNLLEVDAVNGRIGIGTLAPDANLDVAGSLQVDGTTFNVKSDTNRVGIGTDSPTQALDVNGGIRAYGAGGALTIDGSARQITVGSDETLRIYSNTTATNSRSWIELWGNDVSRAGELALSGTYLSLRSGSTTSSSGTERARLDASGNFGIGTTAPEVKLHVSGGGDASLGGGGYLQLGSSTQANVIIDTNEIMARNNGLPDTLALNAEGGNVTVGSTNPGGRVGIGTAAPEAMLHIVDGDNAAIHVGDNPQLVLSRNVANNRFQIYVGGTDYVGKHLQIGRDDSNHDISMMGDVGVGTTNPTAKLDVNGSLKVDGSTLFVDSVANRVGVWTTSPAADLDVNGSFRVDGSVLVVDNVNDRVGVRTASPQTQFHVNGNARVDGTIQITAATRYFSISPWAYRANDSDTDWSGGGSYLEPRKPLGQDFDPVGSFQSFAAPVHLPHGAAVTALWIQLYDNAAGSDFDVDLIRNDLDSVASDTLAHLDTVGTLGWQNLSSTSITNATVDNNNYAYYVLVSFNEPGVWNEMYIGPARITYTVTAPLP